MHNSRTEILRLPKIDSKVKWVHPHYYYCFAYCFHIKKKRNNYSDQSDALERVTLSQWRALSQ